MWGSVLADIARQLAQRLRPSGAAAPTARCWPSIRAAFEADMNNPPDVHSEIAPLT